MLECLTPSLSCVSPTQNKLAEMHYQVPKFFFQGMGFLPDFEMLHKQLDFCLQCMDIFCVLTYHHVSIKSIYALMILFSAKTE